MCIKILQVLTKLDGATLKSDSKLKKFIMRKITKPIGYQARKKLFNLNYK